MSLIFMLNIVPAFAVIYEPIVISGTHAIEDNENLKSINNTFVLAALNDAPMPENSRVTVPANSDFTFGEIAVTKPGTYEYKVSREITESEDLIQDDSVYYIHVAVFSDGTQVMVLSKDGEEGKPDKIEYTDTIVEDEDDSAAKTNKKTNVKTGDTQEILIAGGLFVLVVITLILLRRKKSD